MLLARPLRIILSQSDVDWGTGSFPACDICNCSVRRNADLIEAIFIHSIGLSGVGRAQRSGTAKFERSSKSQRTKGVFENVRHFGFHKNGSIEEGVSFDMHRLAIIISFFSLSKILPGRT